jgi:hypothetical protein
MKEILINDGAKMVVNDNSISFYCRPVLIQKIIGF